MTNRNARAVNALPDAFFTPDSRSGFQPSGFSAEVVQGKPAFPSPAEAAVDAKNAGKAEEPLEELKV
ncbi:MAG: hypothetical protein LBQ42_08045 [Synergistaceae bacterium]|nr:hypothetical protein [Synergistaceae bacterium]